MEHSHFIGQVTRVYFKVALLTGFQDMYGCGIKPYHIIFTLVQLLVILQHEKVLNSQINLCNREQQFPQSYNLYLNSTRLQSMLRS